ncbi:peptidase S8/S53 domain-containing protein [Gilbertella persicaria]|uniref:peptidase S8/S53 domain-containing protein n=1 Tax=Gilbertella persicaria TaxID=101096 RepID=UPI00221E8843|nr:peptidase S8/S53 domain-containing protein [Gilbertella persicaria]KAI8066214.1 peptidase S8/S53 domain-containing protein [Gilbertella persicaria]
MNASLICFVLILALNIARANRTLPANVVYHPKYCPTQDPVIDRNYLIELTENNDLWIESAHIHVKKRFNHPLFTGALIEVVDGQEASLKPLLDHENVVSISPNKMIQLPAFVPQAPNGSQGATLSADMVKSLLPHEFSQVNRVRRELNLTGEGILVGLIDTGIDYRHKAFGGGFGPGYKVVTGYDLVGDSWDYTNDPIPDNDPLDDCGAFGNGTLKGASGHGTHAAGIIAGFDSENGFEGVAPNVKLGVWRVFSCNGASSTGIVVEAMLRAYDAGVHIISISIGTERPWSEASHPQHKVINRLVQNGVHVVVATGNNGRKGPFTVMTPSNAEGAFSVASVDNQYKISTSVVQATGISKLIGRRASGSFSRIPDAELAIAYTGSDPKLLEADACTSESVSTGVSGKIALVRRGGCLFADKIENVASAGAIGALFYNQDNGIKISIALTNDSIPVASISNEDGSVLIQAARNDQVNLTFDYHAKNHFELNMEANSVSMFSSMGPTVELDLKPDIAAVGDTVYSTLPRYLGDYGVLSGTSMACPYVSGAIALYLQQHGINKTNPLEIRERFKNYAYMTNIGVPGSNVLESPLRQGAGAVQVYDAITQPVYVSPAQISFNDTSSTGISYKTHNLTIVHTGTDTVTYQLFNNVSVAISPYNRTNSGYQLLTFPTNVQVYADIQVSTNLVSLESGQNQTVTITVIPPNNIDIQDHIMYSGFIQFEPLNQVNSSTVRFKTLHVPYFGVVGNQRDLPMFDPTFDIVTFDVENKHVYQDNETIQYTLSEAQDDFIGFDYRFVTPVGVHKAEVLRYPSLELMGLVSFNAYQYAQRHTTTLYWNGHYSTQLDFNRLYYEARGNMTMETVPVTSGTFVIRLSALKIFGNQNQPSDWDTWTSKPIMINNE